MPKFITLNVHPYDGPPQHMARIRHAVEAIEDIKVMSSTPHSAIIISEHKHTTFVLSEILKRLGYSPTHRKGQFHDLYFTIVRYPRHDNQA